MKYGRVEIQQGDDWDTIAEASGFLERKRHRSNGSVIVYGYCDHFDNVRSGTVPLYLLTLNNGNVDCWRQD